MRLGFARRLAAVRLHQWRTIDSILAPGRLQKRRTTIGEMLISPGNLYLWAQGALSEVLACRQWIAWETAVSAELERDVRPLEDQTGLEMPIIPGRCLETLLRDNSSPHDKMRGVFQSAVALRKLHQIKLSAGGVSNWPLSHGDATARNVLYDEVSGTASWIDFDMRHRRWISAEIRQADDLRSLLWSSAACLETTAYRDCVDAVFAGYAGSTVTHEVQRLMSDLKRPTVFQLGQAPLSATKFACLRQAMEGRGDGGLAQQNQPGE